MIRGNKSTYSRFLTDSRSPGNFNMPAAAARRAPLTILIILALPLTIRGFSLLSDDENNKSVCQQYHRINVTQQVSYVETYYRGNWDGYGNVATRVNFRTETVSKWRVIEMCCEGYQPRQLADDAEKCVPVCPSGCENGDCDRPNACTCNPGYASSVHELTGHSACLAQCESGCIGGTCVAPNTCICNTGYDLANNGTSCEASCTGVGSSRGCGDNAICLAPDTCQCSDGYVPLEPYDTASLLVNRTEKATFNSPLVVCSPECEPTGCPVNSSCVAPNVCECDQGYQHSFLIIDPPSLLESCLPVCEQTCFNGYCGHPNRCVCNEGYEPHGLLGANLCEPVCRQGDCVNGKCTLPDHCECHDGYEKLVVTTPSHRNVSSNLCLPVCPGNCSHGSCVAPGHCHCDPGYYLSSVSSNPDETPEQRGHFPENPDPLASVKHQTCLPLCEPSCDNGSACVAPNRCQPHPPPPDKNPVLVGYPTIRRARIVNSTNYRATTNGSCTGPCICDSSEQGCTELCAVILITSDAESLRGKFNALESIALVNTTDNTETGSYRDKEAAPYTASLECETECPISILSSENPPRDVLRDPDNCYKLELHNATTSGLLLSIHHGTFLPPIPAVGNNRQTLLCFVNAPGFGCNTTKLGTVRGGVEGGIIGGAAIGAILLVTIVVALFGLSIYMARRKLRNIGSFGAAGVARSNNGETMIERSDATDSPFHTDDSSSPVSESFRD